MPAVTPPDSAATEAMCGNCGTSLAGEYCHTCGARQFAARDLSLRHFASEAVQEFTNLEHSKLLRTLVALLFRPGLLTKEYFSARRQCYIRPLTLCLAIFALSLFVFAAEGPVTMFDSERQARVEYAAAGSMNYESDRLIKTRAERAAAERGESLKQVYDAIDDRWARNASLIQIPQIVFFALILQLAHLRSRRHFVEHLTFSMHFISFQVLTVVLMWPFYYLFGVNFSAPILAVVFAKYGIDTLYLFLALRSFYAEPVKRTLLRAPLTFGGYFLIYGLTHAAAMLWALEAVL